MEAMIVRIKFFIGDRCCDGAQSSSSGGASMRHMEHRSALTGVITAVPVSINISYNAHHCFY